MVTEPNHLKFPHPPHRTHLCGISVYELWWFASRHRMVCSRYASVYEGLLPRFETVSESLRLSLHPDKVFIKIMASGVDFLGWVHFPNHRVLRTSTKRRMINKLSTNKSTETSASYIGMLKHGNTYKLKKKML